MGGRIEFTPEGLLAQKSKLKGGLSIDCSPCPDLAPTLAFLCAHATAPSTNPSALVSLLHGLDALPYKESDRLKEIGNLLGLMGVRWRREEKGEGKRIFIERGEERGKGEEKRPGKFVHYQAPRDHRMAMAAYLFMRAWGGGIIHQAECVDKSFPHFFDVMGDSTST